MKRIATILTLAVVFCFVLASAAQAGSYKKRALKTPIWQIMKDGTGKAVKWVDHKPNRRFAIYDTNGDNSVDPSTWVDDVVLDKETGLVWARDANLAGEKKTWQIAIFYCRVEVELGNRRGWRLPTVEELRSLVETSQSFPSLPIGHPFINLQEGDYWTSTTWESSSDEAWYVSVYGTSVGNYFKALNYLYVWPVRGGNGYATGNW